MRELSRRGGLVRLWEQIEILHKDTVISAELAVEEKIYTVISTERKKRISFDYFTPLSEKVGNIDALKM